jgi:predicted ATP-dependent endonuclease of OLD family
MRLITEIKIEGFRSIRSALIPLTADLTSFAGLNNSGKSNVLRALNAFFNGETDPGKVIDVDRDYFRPDLRKKKRKRILVAVSFLLPKNFKFRKGLEGVKNLLGGAPFTIEKIWTRDSIGPLVSLNGKNLNLEEQQKVNQFLQLIKYRYIPNRVLPTELIRNEHQNLRQVLVRRVGRSKRGQDEAFKVIQDTAERMIRSLAKRFEDACPVQGNVRLATPTSWNNLPMALGYRISQEGGIEFEDTEQGAGIQSFLMLETLYLIDRDYFQQFGWRQAVIWGVEEPEASLHTSLEARVAHYLSQISVDPKSRLQVLCTTHSDLIVQYSGSTILVTQENGESKFQPIEDPREALERVSIAGVARWVHPILQWPLDPIILVEGPSDREFFEEAFRFFKPKRPVHVADIQVLDPNVGGGGKEQMRQYIKNNVSVIKARRHDAPVIVVLDWEEAQKKKEFESLVSGAQQYKVVVWPEIDANPKADKSFKGIERFYSDRMVERAIPKGAPIARKPDGSYTVAAHDYKRVKEVLREIVCEGLEESDFKYAKKFIVGVLQEAGAL